MEAPEINTDNDVIQASIDKLDELQTLLIKLEDKHFKKQVKMLFYATIGQHIRHILEFYWCVLDGIASSEINYDLRKRDLVLETDIKKACHSLAAIRLQLLQIKNNKMITLITNLSTIEGNRETIVSSLYRELVYCLEHCIHHQALIKVGLHELDLMHLVDQDYGVAHSTIRHRKLADKVES